MNCVTKLLQVLCWGWVVTACSLQSGTSAQADDHAVPEKEVALAVVQKSDNPAFRYLNGEIQLSGVLLAYWETLYVEAEPVTLADAEPWQRLQLRFYPDQSVALSSLASSADVRSLQRIFLYRERLAAPVLDELEMGYTPDEGAVLAEVLAPFKRLPAGFLLHREGYVVQPVQVRLDGLVSFVEGDHRFVYGRLMSAEPIAGSQVDLSALADFQPDTYLGQPWRLTYQLQQQTPLHSAPDHGSRVISEVPAGTSEIEKLHTVSAGWVKVQLSDAQGQTQSGYLPKASLWIIN